MIAKKKRLSLTVLGALGLGIVLTGSLGVPEAAFGQAQDVAADDFALEEIIVTSRRRTERLEDVPISVSAFGTEQLDDLNVQDIREIGNFVPNVVLTNFAGRTNNSSIFIRGVGGGDGNPAGLQAGVGIYVDGVYMPRSIGGYMSTMDVERIEVLRGPQGTLFGKNSTGGAINFVSIKPGPESESKWTFRSGTYKQFDARGTVNAPLIEDKLYARISAVLETREGFYTELITGERYSNRRRIAGRAAFRFLPNEHWTVDVSGMFASQPERNPGATCVWDSPGFFQNLLLATDGVNFKESCDRSSLKKRTFESEINGFSDTQIWGANLQTVWDSLGSAMFFDNLQVKLIAAMRGQRNKFLEDSDYTVGRMESRSRIMPVVQSQTTLELQFTGDALDDRFHFVGGLYWADDNTRDTGNMCRDEIASIDADGDGLPDPGLEVQCPQAGSFGFNLLPGAGFVSLLAQIGAKIDTYAFYANASLDVTDWINLTAGVRHTWETRSMFRLDITGVIKEADQATAIINETNVNFNNEGKKTWREWTPTASIRFALPEVGAMNSGNLYFTYARGFQSGGFNTEFPESVLGEAFIYQPETVNSYEVGLKTTLFGGRARFNIAGFVSKFKNRQVQTLVENVGQFVNLDPSLTLITNAASMTINGIEMDFVVRPVDQLTINFALGYIDAKFDEFLNFDPVLGEVVNETDRIVPTLTSKVQWNGSVAYTVYLPAGSTVTPRLTAYYKSGYDYGTNPRRGAPPTALFQKAYAKVDARLTWESESGLYQITAYGKNIFNKDTIRNGSTIRGGPRGWTIIFLEAPAVYGVELQAVF